jgi:hypothetical protein
MKASYSPTSFRRRDKTASRTHAEERSDDGIRKPFIRKRMTRMPLRCNAGDHGLLKGIIAPTISDEMLSYDREQYK